MNFSPKVKAWILLISLVIGTGTGVGITAFLGGSSPWVAFFCGLGTGMTNVYHALSETPNVKAQKTQQPS